MKKCLFIIVVILSLKIKALSIEIVACISGEIRIDVPNNTSKIIESELNGIKLQKIILNKLGLSKSRSEGWSIALTDGDVYFQIVAKFPELEERAASQAIDLLMKYVSSRRKALTKPQSEHVMLSLKEAR